MKEYIKIQTNCELLINELASCHSIKVKADINGVKMHVMEISSDNAKHKVFILRGDL